MRATTQECATDVTCQTPKLLLLSIIRTDPNLSRRTRHHKKTTTLCCFSAPKASPKKDGIIEGNHMRLVLLVVLILLVLGALPTWPYSAGWGYYPSSGLGLVLLIVVVLALMGRL